ncbi:uncharacterized protein LOC116145507 [Pistacia vera]|uniref:uncharacterized protein LOC116145507 n=1 Tax=Pistacia vera TaxID=55513 RepID=UPI001263854D|nr:uncharacterized protein LOC116145507 [Pistacia vera]
MAAYHTVCLLDHTHLPEINLQICRLKASEAASSSSSISHKLNGLQDLHDCINKLLLLPSLAQEKHEKSFDELLDRSLRLLDLCSTAKDEVLGLKEGGKKGSAKGLGRSEGHEKRNAFSNNDNESILKEVEAITLNVFESLLSFISGPQAQSKISGWSLVSKLMHHKKVACVEEEIEANEFAKVDASLQFLIGNKTCKSDYMKQVADLQNQLKNLEL